MRSYYRSNFKRHNVVVFVSGICLMLALFLLLSILSSNVVFDSDINAVFGYWNSYKASSVQTKDGIYQIYTPEDFAYVFCTNQTTNAVLCNNIDLSAHYWQGISFSNNVTFDGQNYSIIGLKLTKFTTNNKTYAGIIPYVTSGSITFNNVNLYVDSGSDTIDADNIGGFVGKTDSGTLNFSRCCVRGEFKLRTDGSCSAGAYVGSAYYASFTRCFNFANLSKYFHGSTTYIGGFAGVATNYTSFNLCANEGNITVQNQNSGITSFAAGGLVGKTKNPNFNNLQSYNAGNINVCGGNIGGVAGFIEGNATIKYAYNTGDLRSGNGVAGGLVGDASGDINFYYAYNTGTITGSKKYVMRNVKINSTPFKVFLYNGSSFPSTTTDVYLYASLNNASNNVEIIGNPDKWKNMSYASSNCVYYAGNFDTPIIKFEYKTSSGSSIFDFVAGISGNIGKDIYFDEYYASPKYGNNTTEWRIYTFNRTMTLEPSTSLVTNAKNYEQSKWGATITSGFSGLNPYLIGAMITSWTGESNYSKGTISIAPLVCYVHMATYKSDSNTGITSVNAVNSTLNGISFNSYYTGRLGYSPQGYEWWANYIIPYKTGGYFKNVSYNNSVNKNATVSNVTYIKNKFTNDSYYTTNTEINNGYPIFKEMYW